MYELPADFNSNVFVGRTLEMLCFNANQIYLHFDAKIIITVEGRYSIQQADDSKEQVREVPSVTHNIFELMERRIISASVGMHSTLALEFENGTLFKCYSSPTFESYQLRIGDNTIVV